MKLPLVLCTATALSIPTHAVGGLRDLISRFSPSAKAKAEREQKRAQRRWVETLRSLGDLELVALDEESGSGGSGAIEEIARSVREEIYRRIIREGERAEILEPLASSLKSRLGAILDDPETAAHFFKHFQKTVQGSPPAYRNILEAFFLDNSGAIMALDPGYENIRALNEIFFRLHSYAVPIKILEEGLNRAKDADGFFAIFEAITAPNPSEDYRNALDPFFAANAEEVGRFAFSAQQAKRMERYINKSRVSLALLGGALKRAKDADGFFAIFEAIATPDPSTHYQDALDTFFTDNAEETAALPLSAAQIRRIDTYINRHTTTVVLLKSALDHAKNSIDFLRVFNAVAPNTPTKSSVQIYADFLFDNSGAIDALDSNLLRKSPLMMKKMSLFVDVDALIEDGRHKRGRKGRAKRRRKCASGVDALAAADG